MYFGRRFASAKLNFKSLFAGIFLTELSSCRDSSGNNVNHACVYMSFVIRLPLNHWL